MGFISKNYKWGIIIASLLAVYLSVSQCTENKRILEQNESNYLVEVEGLKRNVDKQGREIVSQRQIIVQKGSEAAKLIDRVEGLRKIKQQVKVITKTIIPPDTTKVPDPIIIRDSLDFSYLRLPFGFGLQNRWFGYGFRVFEDGSIIRDSLTFISEPVISFGYEDKKWYQVFKKNVPMVSYRDNNPYIVVQDMSNIVIEDPKKRLGLGFFIGPAVSKSGIEPVVIGFGLTIK